MNLENFDRAHDIHEYIHNIKSSLQSLMVANELVLEDEKIGAKNDNLLRTMMEDIRRIHQTVNNIERDFGGDAYGS